MYGLWPHGPRAYDQVQDFRERMLRANARTHGESPYAQGPMHKGMHPNISQEWVLYMIIVIFNDFCSSFGDFGPILGVIGSLFDARS
jgi:hypothetical protein